MSFLNIRLATLSGERKAHVSLSAVSYIQEIIPDQDIMWQVGVEPSRTLIYLHHRLDPIISLDRPEDLMKQVKGKSSDTHTTELKSPKKVK